MKLRKTLEADLYHGRRKPLFWLRVLKIMMFGGGGQGCTVTLRLMQHFYANGPRFLARSFRSALERKFGCYISPSATIGPGLKLPHPVGIVIGDGVVIGAHARIYQHATLGGRVVGDMHRNAYPTIGDNVTIFAGACVLGAVKIGDRCTIGANAVLLQDAPSDSVAVGAPARIAAAKTPQHLSLAKT